MERMAGSAEPQGDRALAEGLQNDGASGLAGLYAAYADRLYTYAITQTRDRDAAADAVADTFLLARDRIGQLRDPDKLRPWLYAICRNECLRHHRQSSRVADLEAAGPMKDTTIDLDRGLAADDAAALVDQVLPGLNASDRELLELALRHELATDEIGAALGMPTNQASARLSRAKQQFQRAVGALVVFRVGGQDCTGLASIVDGAKFDALTRKRVARHVDACATCGRRRTALVAELSSSYAWPLQPAPAQLADRVLAATTGGATPAGSGTARSGLARGAAMAAASAAILAVLVGLGATALGTSVEGDPRPVTSAVPASSGSGQGAGTQSPAGAPRSQTVASQPTQSTQPQEAAAVAVQMNVMPATSTAPADATAGGLPAAVEPADEAQSPTAAPPPDQAVALVGTQPASPPPDGAGEQPATAPTLAATDPTPWLADTPAAEPAPMSAPSTPVIGILPEPGIAYSPPPATAPSVPWAVVPTIVPTPAATTIYVVPVPE